MNICTHSLSFSLMISSVQMANMFIFEIFKKKSLSSPKILKRETLNVCATEDPKSCLLTVMCDVHFDTYINSEKRD